MKRSQPKKFHSVLIKSTFLPKTQLRINIVKFSVTVDAWFYRLDAWSVKLPGKQPSDYRNSITRDQT